MLDRNHANNSVFTRNHLGLVIVAAALLQAGCSTSTHATKWEYREVSGVTTDKINQMADEGWTVAGFSQYDASGTIRTSYLLKRPKAR